MISDVIYLLVATCSQVASALDTFEPSLVFHICRIMMYTIMLKHYYKRCPDDVSASCFLDMTKTVSQLTFSDLSTCTFIYIYMSYIYTYRKFCIYKNIVM